MKIWVDDIRTPPDGSWSWTKESEQAIKWLECVKADPQAFGGVTVMSLDHDLGDYDTTRPVVLWMCDNGFWPDKVLVHSKNPVGVEWLEGMIERYKT